MSLPLLHAHKDHMQQATNDLLTLVHLGELRRLFTKSFCTEKFLRKSPMGNHYHF